MTLKNNIDPKLAETTVPACENKTDKNGRRDLSGLMSGTYSPATKMSRDHLNYLISHRLKAIGDDRLPRTSIQVFDSQASEYDVAQRLGFSPLINPISGRGYGEKGFRSFWKFLGDYEQWFEMDLSFGDFSFVLFFEEDEGLTTRLSKMCREYAEVF